MGGSDVQLLTRMSKNVLRKAWAGLLLGKVNGWKFCLFPQTRREEGAESVAKSWSCLLHSVPTTFSGLCLAQLCTSLQKGWGGGVYVQVSSCV